MSKPSWNRIALLAVALLVVTTALVTTAAAGASQPVHEVSSVPLDTEWLAALFGCTAPAGLQAEAKPLAGGGQSDVAYLGGCGGPNHSLCTTACDVASLNCYGNCSTPLCYFQCRQQDEVCLNSCDTQYGCY